MAWLFNETDSYATVPDSSLLTLPSDAWSLGGRFKLDDNDGSFFQYFLSWNGFGEPDSINVYIGESSQPQIPDQIRVGIVDANDDEVMLTSTNTFDSTEWQSLMVLRSSTSFRLYVNGVLEDTASNSLIEINHDQPIYFGARSDLNSARHLGGQMQEWACWNRVISADEVTALSNGVSPLNAGSGLVWHMEMIGGRYTDTITGMTATPNNISAAKHGPLFKRHRMHGLKDHLDAFVAEHPFIIGEGEIIAANAIAKTVGEEIAVSMDLTPLLGDGDGLHEVIKIKNDGGLLTSDITINGDEITWKISAGVLDVIGRCEVHFETTRGDRLVASGIVEVVD